MTINSQSQLIHSYDSWTQLQEVWLGDVYPVAWYDHLAPAVRDVFHQLTEITQADLAVIQQQLESFGITVRRPVYNNIDDFVNLSGQLEKPQITPRDHFVVVGNSLYGLDSQFGAWHNTVAQYCADADSHIVPHTDRNINGANVVRVGRDIIVDRDCTDWQYSGQWPEHRVQVVANGGHMDGCFAILRPGLLIANHYWDEYEKTFPGWDIIQLDNPTYGAAPSRGYAQQYPVYNGKFWDTTVGTNNAFNDHVMAHALDWVGCYTETYFELNCLVINESNVVMLGENLHIERELAQRGITVHWVPFRARSFWDGAMHCLTVDIRRVGQNTDYLAQQNPVHL